MSKGKQPRTRVNKVPKLLLSEIKAVFIPNSQGIGLEAAIFWRPRNRALVCFLWIIIHNKDKSTENLTDLNYIPRPCPYILMYPYFTLYIWGSGTLGSLWLCLYKA